MVKRLFSFAAGTELSQQRNSANINGRMLGVSPYKQATGFFIFKRKALIKIKITAKHCLFPTRALPNWDKRFKSIFSEYFLKFGLDFSKSCGILVVKKKSKKG